MLMLFTIGINIFNRIVLFSQSARIRNKEIGKDKYHNQHNKPYPCLYCVSKNNFFICKKLSLVLEDEVVIGEDEEVLVHNELISLKVFESIKQIFPDLFDITETSCINELLDSIKKVKTKTLLISKFTFLSKYLGIFLSKEGVVLIEVCKINPYLIQRINLKPNNNKGIDYHRELIDISLLKRISKSSPHPIDIRDIDVPNSSYSLVKYLLRLTSNHKGRLSNSDRLRGWIPYYLTRYIRIGIGKLISLFLVKAP